MARGGDNGGAGRTPGSGGGTVTNADDGREDGRRAPLGDLPIDRTYIGRAVPREGRGWRIQLERRTDPDGPGTEVVAVGECATLARLEERTWELVRSITDDPDVRVVTAPRIDDELMMRVIGAWRAMAEAKRAEGDAARQVRVVVGELRELGLSITDIAFLTHVSRGRVSQLLAQDPRRGRRSGDARPRSD